MDRIDAETRGPLPGRSFARRRAPRAAADRAARRDARRATRELRRAVPREQGGHRRALLPAHGEHRGRGAVGRRDALRRRTARWRSASYGGRSVGRRRDGAPRARADRRAASCASAAASTRPRRRSRRRRSPRCEAWRDGVPANPGAWLMTAAKNSARDARRHRAVAAREGAAPRGGRDGRARRTSTR